MMAMKRETTARRDASGVMQDERRDEVTSLARRMFGQDPRRVAFPGGKSRAAFIADMGDEAGSAPQPWVFAKRSDLDDAQMEAIVLKALQPSGHTPRLKGRFERWVVQEALPGTRLPLVLDRLTNPAEREALIVAALDALVAIHETADRVGLQHRVPKVGTVDGWLWNRTGAAKRIARTAGIDAPDIDRDWLVERMDVRRSHFVKWDARPGNALVHHSADGAQVSWFDWEDCGRSTPLDDLAFVLFDEWTPLDEAATRRLMARYTPRFAGRLKGEEADLYLRLFAMTHTVLRLRMALKLHARKDEWWDRGYCLDGDKVGVTPVETANLIRRGLWLAREHAKLAPYAPWLEAVAQRYAIPL